MGRNGDAKGHDAEACHVVHRTYDSHGRGSRAQKLKWTEESKSSVNSNSNGGKNWSEAWMSDIVDGGDNGVDGPGTEVEIV